MVWSLIQACADAIKASRRSDPGQRTCLTFLVSGLLFGIDTASIEEIVPCGIMAVPRDKPHFLRGFFRHGGRMVPIVDLARRYSDHVTEIGGRTCIVIVSLDSLKPRKHGHRHEIGILVDEVRGLTEFDLHELKPLPETFRRTLTLEIVDGLMQLPRDLLIVLGIQRLLKGEEAQELLWYYEQMDAE